MYMRRKKQKRLTKDRMFENSVKVFMETGAAMIATDENEKENSDKESVKCSSNLGTHMPDGDAQMQKVDKVTLYY